MNHKYKWTYKKIFGVITIIFVCLLGYIKISKVMRNEPVFSNNILNELLSAGVWYFLSLSIFFAFVSFRETIIDFFKSDIKGKLFIIVIVIFVFYRVYWNK